MINEAELKVLQDNVSILADFSSSKEFKAKVQLNSDVRTWLGKVGFKTKPRYVMALSYFMRCVGTDDPSWLLNLKGFDDPKKRFYPAEQLLEYWLLLAKEKHLEPYKIKSVMDAVRSFYKKNRARLIDVAYTYKPKEKPSITREDLLRFRESMTWWGRIVLDFLVSVPLRDGQFQTCPNCNRDFHPRWQHILTYPSITEYSPFVIAPEKGHESSNYPSALRQVCFLTKSCADQLNSYRAYKERILGRQLKPLEYIFTFSQHSRFGEYCVSPVRKDAVKMLFYNTQPKAGIRIYPHLIRSYVNSVLSAQGIDKMVRDIYLGHLQRIQIEDEGYILQMIPLWQQRFRETHALEALDLLNPSLHNLVEMETRMEEMRQILESPKQKAMEKGFEVLSNVKVWSSLKELNELLKDPEIRELLNNPARLRKLKELSL